MRKCLLAVLPIVVVLASCQTGVTMWGACSDAAGADHTGTDGTYVLLCRNGRWEPVMTVNEYLAIARRQPVAIAPLPTPPTTATTTTTTTTSSTSSTTTIAPAPVTFVSIEAGSDHTCAVTSAGGVKCWGLNNVGQLGDGNTTDSSTPVDVIGLASGVAAVSSLGSHSCALTAGGGVKCWGYNAWGELGDGTTTNQATPVDVMGLSSGAASVEVGANFSCVVTTAGGAKCWGDNHVNQIGDGTATTRPSPTDVSGLTSGVAAISAGVYHTCALTTSGGAKCWGLNMYGRVGDGTTTNRTTPVDVTGLTSGVASIVAGQTHTCAVTTGGGAKCWGFNNAGRLGDGTTTNRSTPVDVTGLTSGVASISGGDRQTCAVTTGGGVQCWGFNGYGQLGDGSNTDRSTPVAVDGLTSGVASVSGGSSHTCALTTNGSVKCWGANYNGELGDGTTTNSNEPVDVVI